MEQKTGLLRTKVACVPELQDTCRQLIEDTARRDMVGKIVEVLRDGRAYVIQYRAKWSESCGERLELTYTCLAFVVLAHIKDAQIGELAVASFVVEQDAEGYNHYLIECGQKDIQVDIVPPEYYRGFDIAPALWRRVS